MKECELKRGDEIMVKISEYKEPVLAKVEGKGKGCVSISRRLGCSTSESRCVPVKDIVEVKRWLKVANGKIILQVQP